MSQLMIQMAQEMNRRAARGWHGDPSQSSGTSNDSKKEMRMDEKWIPAMPKSWTSRGRELSGFKS